MSKNKSSMQTYLDKHGIKAAPSKHSIGFSASEQKWYGWSHRAIFGFGVGHILKKGDCAATSRFTDEHLASHPNANRGLPVGFKANTLADAKRMAVAFAESVS
jgi:hypothetical protein